MSLLVYRVSAGSQHRIPSSFQGIREVAQDLAGVDSKTVRVRASPDFLVTGAQFQC